MYKYIYYAQNNKLFEVHQRSVCASGKFAVVAVMCVHKCFKLQVCLVR